MILKSPWKNSPHFTHHSQLNNTWSLKPSLA
jgi:hypothetical protein